MSGPLALVHLLEGLEAHVAASLGVDSSNAEEMTGVSAMAIAAADYFSSMSKGAPPGSGRALMWVIYSALWEGRVEQEEIDKFFGTVDIDPVRLFDAWRKLQRSAPGSPFTVALIPGRLDEAGITEVASALYIQKRG